MRTEILLYSNNLCHREKHFYRGKGIARPTSRSISGRRGRMIEPLTKEKKVFHTQLLLDLQSVSTTQKSIRPSTWTLTCGRRHYLFT